MNPNCFSKNRCGQQFLPSHLSAPTLHSVPARIMTCHCLRSSAISVVIWFLGISSFTSHAISAFICLDFAFHLPSSHLHYISSFNPTPTCPALLDTRVSQSLYISCIILTYPSGTPFFRRHHHINSRGTLAIWFPLLHLI